MKDNEEQSKKAEISLEERNKELTELNVKKFQKMSEKKEVKESLIKTDVATVENNIVQINEKLSIERAKFTTQKEE